MDERLIKPTNLGGTRWIPHIERALSSLLKNYKTTVLHMENSIEERAGSAAMQGRARQVLGQLRCYRGALFVHLVLDILQCLS